MGRRTGSTPKQHASRFKERSASPASVLAAVAYPPSDYPPSPLSSPSPVPPSGYSPSPVPPLSTIPESPRKGEAKHDTHVMSPNKFAKASKNRFSTRSGKVSENDESMAEKPDQETHQSSQPAFSEQPQGEDPPEEKPQGFVSASHVPEYYNGDGPRRESVHEYSEREDSQDSYSDDRPVPRSRSRSRSDSVEPDFYKKLHDSVADDEIYYEDYTNWTARKQANMGLKLADDTRRTGRVNLAVLSRMYLSTLRRELVCAAKRCDDAEMPVDLKTMMHTGFLLETYCKAIDRYNQVSESQTLGAEDPFVIDTTSDLDTTAMLEAQFIPRSQVGNFHSGEPHPYGGSRRAKNRQEMIHTFSTALLGGIALLIPMLVMVFYKSLNVTVITVCVSVIIVSGVLAIFSYRSAFEILTATAAYAAVLVVFVGASS